MLFIYLNRTTQGLKNGRRGREEEGGMRKRELFFVVAKSHQQSSKQK